MKVKIWLSLTMLLGIFLINGLNIPFLNPASAHASSQIIIADVFTKSFSVIYNLSEPPQGNLGLWVYNSTGDRIVDGITIENESAPANLSSPNALSNKIVKFTVKGLAESTSYYIQLRVNDSAFRPTENPFYYGQEYMVTTERLNDTSYQIEKNIVTNDPLLFPPYKTSMTSTLGSSLVLVNILDSDGKQINDRPLSSWVGSGSFSEGQPAACINLNNLYDRILKTPLELNGVKIAEITYLNEAQAPANREAQFTAELLQEATVETTWGPKSIPYPRVAYFYYRDADLDGYGSQELSLFFRPIPPSGYCKEDNDCNDKDAQINPGKVEQCDGKDNNCNGLVDEGGTIGCTTYYKDADGDGYGLAGESKCLCAPDVAGKYTAIKTGDCNDADVQVYPGAVEQCDGKDNNCNGRIDEEGCTTYYKDVDGDGYGLAGESKCLCAPDVAGKYTAIKTGDCNDADAQIHPGAVEQCDGKDNDCDGKVDEDLTPRPCTTVCGTGEETCQSGKWTGCTAKQPVNEVCGDSVDNNCDGVIDEGCCNGDLTGDGGITPADALFAFRCYLGSGPCTPCVDVNNDKMNTPADALLLFRRFLGFSN